MVLFEKITLRFDTHTVLSATDGTEFTITTAPLVSRALQRALLFIQTKVVEWFAAHVAVYQLQNNGGRRRKGGAKNENDVQIPYPKSLLYYKWLLAEAIKCTKCDYISHEHPTSENDAGDSDTGWLGILGHEIGVQEVPGLNPGGTTMIFPPVFPGDARELGLKYNHFDP